MHDLAFANAFHVPPFSVLGVRLRNYAIGHELALIRDGNPLVTYTESAFAELALAVQKTALAGAVEVCALKTPRFRLLWALRANQMPLGRELSAFRQYRAAGSLDLPTVKQPRTSGVPFHYFGAPELARLLNYVTEKHSVMIQTHFEGSPLNFPLGLARILHATQLEADGSIWVENFHDAEEKKRKEIYEKLNPEPGIAVGEEAVKEFARKWNLQHPEAPVPES